MRNIIEDLILIKRNRKGIHRKWVLTTKLTKISDAPNSVRVSRDAITVKLANDSSSIKELVPYQRHRHVPMDQSLPFTASLNPSLCSKHIQLHPGVGSFALWFLAVMNPEEAKICLSVPSGRRLSRRRGRAGGAVDSCSSTEFPHHVTCFGIWKRQNSKCRGLMELEEHSLGAGQMMAFAAELVRVLVSAACSASPAWICTADKAQINSQISPKE